MKKKGANKSPRGKTEKPSSIPQPFVTDSITGEKVYSDTVQPGGWGYTPQSSNGEYELELSQNKIIYTERHFNYTATPNENRSDASRLVLSGSYTYKNGSASGSTDRVTLFTFDSANGISHESGSSSRLSNFNSNPLDFTRFLGQNNSVDYSFGRTSGQIDRSLLSGLADAQYYSTGWWDNPFAPNLI